ncbi:MAG TPA: hypothetical protein VEW06_06450 [Xanthobacteraceae bacterium]|nr:hypothetical protein [Xanthobacteraceae bacterium]
MSDRITEEQAPVPVTPLAISTVGDVPLVDDAIPLVRDEAWQWYAVFFEDSNTPTDLTGKTVTAELRWAVGEQAVTVAPVVDAPGQVELSLAAEDTALMPYGQLLQLYLAIDGITASEPVPVNVV